MWADGSEVPMVGVSGAAGMGHRFETEWWINDGAQPFGYFILQGVEPQITDYYALLQKG